MFAIDAIDKLNWMADESEIYREVLEIQFS